MAPLKTFGLASAATALLGGPVRAALVATGSLDVPNHRSSHHTPVPRGGGLAGLLGATGAALLTQTRLRRRTVASILGLASLGWMDDLFGHVPAPLRLAAQAGAGAFGLGHADSNTALDALATAGVVNVVNFMDGINGISGLTAVVWGVNAMLLDDDGDGQLPSLGALTAGAGAGFLPHNVPAARLFLGDIGSYALGSAMVAGILSQRSLQSRYQVGAPLILYAADALQALARRAASGKPLGEAHREHIYQRMVDGGRTHVEVAVMHAVAATAVAGASRLTWPWSIAVTATVVTAYIAAVPRRPVSGQTNPALRGRGVTA